MAGSFLGNVVDTIGTGLHLPEFGLSEALSGNQRSTYTGLTPQSQAAGYSYNPANPSSINGQYATPQVKSGSTGQVQGIFSGPAYGPSVPSSAGGGYGQVPSNPNPQNYGSQVQGVNSSDIDNAYNDASNYYNQIYNDTLNNKQSYLDQFTTPYDALQPGIQTAYDQGVNLNKNQVNQTNQQASNAIEAARNAYHDLSQGVQQRFGGANSAGDFANAFFGRQFQQNLGQVANTQTQNLNSLQAQHANLLSQYNANMQQLNSQRATALAQAQQSFQDRLNAINDAKGQLAQNKAQMKISALQDYRNTINSLVGQAQATANQILAQHQASVDQLKNTIAGFQAYAGQPINLSMFGNPNYAALGNGTQYVPVTNISGYYDPTKQNQQQF